MTFKKCFKYNHPSNPLRLIRLYRWLYLNHLSLAKVRLVEGFGIRDIGLFLRDTGIFVFLFWEMGPGIFSNFGIWDVEIYFGIRVKLIFGYGIFWTVYFGIWDIAYPP